MLSLHVTIVVFVVGALVLIVVGNLRSWRWVNALWFRFAHLVAIAIVVLGRWNPLGVALAALVFGAVAIRFLKPDWDRYAYWGAWAGLVCVLVYTLSQWRDIAAAGWSEVGKRVAPYAEDGVRWFAAQAGSCACANWWTPWNSHSITFRAA